MMIEPTKKICELFYNRSLKGASECGRFSAEYGLKGIYKILVKLCSPEVLIKKANTILTSYYKPSKLEIAEQRKGYTVVHITHFPESDSYVEYRIAGWMERAIEICGCRNVNVNITSSLTNNDPYTEYKISWR